VLWFLLYILLCSVLLYVVLETDAVLSRADDQLSPKTLSSHFLTYHYQNNVYVKKKPDCLILY